MSLFTPVGARPAAGTTIEAETEFVRHRPAGHSAGNWRWFLRLWLRDWGGVLTVAMGLYCALLSGWLLIGRPTTEEALVPIAIAYIGFLPAAVLLTWRLSSRTELNPTVRRAWRLVAAGHFVYWIGALLWSFTASGGVASQFNSPADVFFTASYPLYLWALRTFPGRVLSRPQTVTTQLDAAIVLFSGMTFILYAVVGPNHITHHAWSIATLVGLLYPLGDLVLLAGVLLVLFRRPADSERSLLILAVGLALLTGGDVAWAHLRQHDASQPANWILITWVISAYLMALSPQLRISQLAMQQNGSSPEHDRQARNLLPYVAVAASFGLVLAIGLPMLSPVSGGLVLGMVVVTGLLFTRQILTLRENSALTIRRVARESEERFRSLVQHSSDMITVVSRDLTVRYQSPSIDRLFGHRASELIGTRFSILAHPEDAAQLRAFCSETLAQPGASGRLSWRLRRLDGSWSYVETIGTNLHDDHAVQGIVLNTRDISQRVALEQQLSHRAFHDPLTDLPNRALFMDRMAHGLERLTRRRETLAVLFLDIDDFKAINDRLGHAAGDQLLQGVADRLSRAIRTGDTAARLGGDEFTILAEDLSDGREALALAQRVEQAFKQPFALDGHEVRASVSIGVAIGGPDDSPQRLLLHADQALYQAKGRGKARFEVFNRDWQPDRLLTNQ